MLRRSLVFALALGLAPGVAAAVSFETVVGFATKTGFRAVVAWQADAPVAGIVEYGTSAGNLSETALPLANLVDRAQMAVIDGFTTGTTIHYRVVDQLTNTASTVKTFQAANAYTAWNGSTYTINALAQLDNQALPDEIPFDLGLRDFAAGMNILAERIHDALDGYARVGTVLVTDTVLDYPVNQPFGPGLVCATGVAGAGAVGPTLADFLVETTIPLDSHTFGGWMIDDPCTAFYIGRLGWLVNNFWEDDLDLGYTMAHEFMHYAFDAPDLYTLNSDADCRNLDWDGSLLHNSGGWNADAGTWELTELDENSHPNLVNDDPLRLTPCDHGSQPWSWTVLQQRYVNVPDRSSIQNVFDTLCRGNPDGGALEIWILDNEPPMSTLTSFMPEDGAPCP